MIPVLNVDQIRRADAYTIDNEPISSLDLMERASSAFVSAFKKLYPHVTRVVVICGTGNNGGDGLAIARMLHFMGASVKPIYIGDRLKASQDFRANYERLPVEATEWCDGILSGLPEGSLIIDAMFGSGLSRPIAGRYATAVQEMNQCGMDIVAVDIPSGLFADEPTPSSGTIVRAVHTVSFQVPKLVFFQPSASEWVGEWLIVDIGLDLSFLSGGEVHSYFMEQQDLMLPKRGKFSHKGHAGRLLLVAGSKGHMGAAILSSRAALRAGIGLLFIHTASCGLEVLQVSVPEAMVEVDAHQEVVSGVDVADNLNAVAIGPGLGTGAGTTRALSGLLQEWRGPIVLDADALNILAQKQELLSQLPEGAVLTPHPGEFKRLVGGWNDDFDKLEKLIHFCKHYRVNVVLKGAHSVICSAEGKLLFNSTGNPGMATGGSGDVLTGIVGAFLAQGLLPLEALKAAVYLHGLAGDIGIKSKGNLSLIASDIVEALPEAIALQGSFCSEGCLS